MPRPQFLATIAALRFSIGFYEAPPSLIVTLPGSQTVPAVLAYTQNVVPASYAGLTGLSLPIGLTSAGLPVGLELDGLEGSDEVVIGIDLSMKTALPRLPPPPIP